MNRPDPDAMEPLREKEVQDTNYHDEELEIQNDEEGRPRTQLPRRKVVRRPPPRRRFYED